MTPLRALLLSPRLVHPHVPFNKPPYLPRRVTAREHAFDEFVVLVLRVRVFFRFKTDDGKKIFHLAEHPLFDDGADLLVRRPGGILAVVGRAIAERELHDFVSEILWVGDSRWLFDLRKLVVQGGAIQQLTRVRILVI